MGTTAVCRKRRYPTSLEIVGKNGRSERIEPSTPRLPVKGADSDIANYIKVARSLKQELIRLMIRCLTEGLSIA
jgi:hypothetical protein